MGAVAFRGIPTAFPAARAVASAAVSAGLAPWGLGSDTGGSIKQPSALCGNVGLRPTYGSVSRYGVVAIASSLDQIGPVAKTVRDVALLYSIIAGRDASDSTTVELPEPVALQATVSTVCGSRCRISSGSLDAIEPGVRAAFERAVELARKLGAEVGECDLPTSYRYGMPCYYLIAPAEASNLARYDGVRYGPRADAATYDEMVERATTASARSPSDGSCSARTRCRPATTTPSTARRRRCALLIREHREALERFDVIATPTSPPSPSRSGTRLRTRSRCTPATCSRSRPVSRVFRGSRSRAGSRTDFRSGCQLLGAQFGENTLFRAGHALEQAIAFDTVPERLR